MTDDELINGVPDHQFFLGFKTAPISDDVLFNDDDKYYHYYSEWTLFFILFFALHHILIEKCQALNVNTDLFVVFITIIVSL